MTTYMMQKNGTDRYVHSKWLSKGKTYLPHVGNIEERGLAVTTAPQVLLHDASVLAALVQDR